MKWLYFSFSLLMIGLFGALLSKRISDHTLPWYYAIIPSILSGSVWGIFVRNKGINLSLASVIFDVVYTASYVAGFVMLGDKLTVTQVLGFIVSGFGIVLMSL